MTLFQNLGCHRLNSAVNYWNRNEDRHCDTPILLTSHTGEGNTIYGAIFQLQRPKSLASFPHKPANLTLKPNPNPKLTLILRNARFWLLTLECFSHSILFLKLCWIKHVSCNSSSSSRSKLPRDNLQSFMLWSYTHVSLWWSSSIQVSWWHHLVSIHHSTMLDCRLCHIRMPNHGFHSCILFFYGRLHLKPWLLSDKSRVAFF